MASDVMEASYPGLMIREVAFACARASAFRQGLHDLIILEEESLRKVAFDRAESTGRHDQQSCEEDLRFKEARTRWNLVRLTQMRQAYLTAVENMLSKVRRGHDDLVCRWPGIRGEYEFFQGLSPKTWKEVVRHKPHILDELDKIAETLDLALEFEKPHWRLRESSTGYRTLRSGMFADEILLIFKTALSFCSCENCVRKRSS